jgi:arsenite-transporting ATPase
MEDRGRAALACLPDALRALPRDELPLRPAALVGLPALRALSSPVEVTGPAIAPPEAVAAFPPLSSLVDSLSSTGRGVVLTMGKGGVGKTTVAAAVALELARRGHRVHLTTTDPAAHVADAVAGDIPGLSVTRIGPAEETRRYREEVLGSVGPELDEKGRALLEEDLRSPCTEEVAVFRAFARTVAEGEQGIVVLDTAPTGHTILLLDAAESYHREVLRQGSRMPETVRHLLPRLRDGAFTRVLLVTLPEATPVHEARALQEDLARAGISPFGWIVNQSLAPVPTRDPLLAARRAAERPYLDEVEALASRLAVVPWVMEPPRGTRGLGALVGAAPAPARVEGALS